MAGAGVAPATLPSREMRALILLAAALLLGQEPKPPDPAAAPAEAKPEAPAKPVYRNEGKPILLPFTCGEEDINNFGLTCTPDEPCEAYLELSAIDNFNGKLYATGNIHTSSTTLWSVLLLSEDEGKTWSEAFERMRSTALEHMQFLDLDYGWISGQTLVSLPKDPFLLATTDGGKIWRKKPVSGESRVGAIENFVMESRTTGQLLVDRTQTGNSGGRHEYFETNTGGDTWGLRQVSPKPIVLKKARPVSNLLRIQADARTKSFRLEKREAQRWTPLASFLVKVGECKSSDELREPPPPTEEAKPDSGTFVIPSEKGPRRPPTLKKKK